MGGILIDHKKGGHLMKKLILIAILCTACSLEAPAALDTYDDGYDDCIADSNIDELTQQIDTLASQLSTCEFQLADERWTFDYETGRLNDLNLALKHKIAELEAE